MLGIFLSKCVSLEMKIVEKGNKWVKKQNQRSEQMACKYNDSQLYHIIDELSQEISGASGPNT